jgi:hypothetical protein
MSVEIGIEAAQFPKEKYINGISVAVHAAPKYIKICPLSGFFQ